MNDFPHDKDGTGRKPVSDVTMTQEEQAERFKVDQIDLIEWTRRADDCGRLARQIVAFHKAMCDSRVEISPNFNALEARAGQDMLEDLLSTFNTHFPERG